MKKVCRAILISGLAFASLVLVSTVSADFITVKCDVGGWSQTFEGDTVTLTPVVNQSLTLDLGTSTLALLNGLDWNVTPSPSGYQDYPFTASRSMTVSMTGEGSETKTISQPGNLLITAPTDILDFYAGTPVVFDLGDYTLAVTPQALHKQDDWGHNYGEVQAAYFLLLPDGAADVPEPAPMLMGGLAAMFFGLICTRNLRK